jgi:hypothetical protein
MATKTFTTMAQLNGFMEHVCTEAVRKSAQRMCDKLREYITENGNITDDGKLSCEWAHLEPQTDGLRIK